MNVQKQSVLADSREYIKKKDAINQTIRELPVYDVSGEKNRFSSTLSHPLGSRRRPTPTWRRVSARGGGGHAGGGASLPPPPTVTLAALRASKRARTGQNQVASEHQRHREPRATHRWLLRLKSLRCFLLLRFVLPRSWRTDWGGRRFSATMAVSALATHPLPHTRRVPRSR